MLPVPQTLLNCSFPSWYPNYKTITIDSIILKAPPSFVEYLLSDEGLFLPEPLELHDRSTASVSGNNTNSNVITSGMMNSSDVTENGSILERSDNVQNRFNSDDFKEFQALVENSIKKLGGKVFPKLNWSSPKDATWIAMNNSLSCQSFVDICLLLKSSDVPSHDLTNPYKIFSNINSETDWKTNPALVLRRWTDIAPSSEYRCFVKNKVLFAICQRHLQYYSFIDADKINIVKCINRFFKQHVQLFPEDSYTFDVSLPSISDILLIDFNPFTEVTDSILFSWDELNGDEQMPEAHKDTSSRINGIVFRSVPKEGITSGNDMRLNAYPIDFQHLSTGEDPLKLIDLLKLQQKENNSSSDSEQSQ